jgi:alpha-amylase/alpha-mannosidase (GH57 family)
MAGAGNPMQRYICIHGHFYQPPRENAWLEAVERQESAYPYHDWNQRINAECYAANARARILDDADRITQIVNNYQRISFNFGPTLLSWLEAHDPVTYTALLEADGRSIDRFSGHGSALAQAYSHPILPLCNERDKQTQIRWGIRDFKHRFKRSPEGMWLPETAVDTATLEALAAAGIQFTILDQSQALQARQSGDAEWTDVSGGSIDTRRPYVVNLPSGARFTVFFYDGQLARAVAFERLLHKGETFADRLVDSFTAGDDAQLVHIATDGETYGHHHRFGEMALAYAIHDIEQRDRARITNYGEFLELHPPTHEVRIKQRTAWSCAHGLGRWSTDCGCSDGSKAGWTQAWRAPLRQALDFLRDTLAPQYAERAGHYLKDPWAARDAYIDVILDRSPLGLKQFLDTHATHELSPAETTTLLKLLELQRHALLMYTSCGWFFDEINRIETRQILQYAGRVLQLAEAFPDHQRDREQFLTLLGDAPSNLAEIGTGRTLFERKILPAGIDLPKVAANFGACLLFGDTFPADAPIGFEIECLDQRILNTGAMRLALGRAHITSRVTLESADLVFGFLHHGTQNLRGGIRDYPGEPEYQKIVGEFTSACSRNSPALIEDLLDTHFNNPTYSLIDMFRDQQQKILEHLLASPLRNVEAVYRRLYKGHSDLMRFLARLDTSQPRALRVAAELVVNTGLIRALQSRRFNPAAFSRLIEDAKQSRIPLDEAALGFTASNTLERMLTRLTRRPSDQALLQRIGATVTLVNSLGFEIDLHGSQNLYYALLQKVYPGYVKRAAAGDENAQHWLDRFTPLGEALKIAVTATPVNTA